MGEEETTVQGGEGAASGGVHVRVMIYGPVGSDVGFTSSDVFDGWHFAFEDIVHSLWEPGANSYDDGPKWIRWSIGLVGQESELGMWTLDPSCYPDGHKFKSGSVANADPHYQVYGFESDYFRTNANEATIKVSVNGQTVSCAYSGFDTSRHK